MNEALLASADAVIAAATSKDDVTNFKSSLTGFGTKLSGMQAVVAKSPVASLATALAGLKINRERGDILRQRIAGLTRRLLNGFIAAGFDLAEHRGFPIVNVELGGPDAVLRGLAMMWEAGLVVTPSVFPAASLSRGGVRFSVTADNTEDEVDRAIQTMAHVARQLRVGAGA